MAIAEFLEPAVKDYAKQAKATYSAPIDTTKFSHLVYTFTNTGVVKIYINGTQEYTATHSNCTFPSVSNIMIGHRYDLNGEGILGDIPTVRVYSTALTAAQVLQNYNAQKSRFGL